MNGYNEPPGLLFGRQPRDRYKLRPQPMHFRHGGVAGDGMPPTDMGPNTRDPLLNPGSLPRPYYDGRGVGGRTIGGFGGYSGSYFDPALGGFMPMGGTPISGPTMLPATWSNANTGDNNTYAPQATAANSGGSGSTGTTISPFGSGYSQPSGPASQMRLVLHMNEGGMVPGRYSHKDTVPAMLSPGEVVLNRGQQSKISLEPNERAALPPEIVQALYRARMNRKKPQHFAGGGVVSSDDYGPEKKPWNFEQLLLAHFQNGRGPTIDEAMAASRAQQLPEEVTRPITERWINGQTDLKQMLAETDAAYLRAMRMRQTEPELRPLVTR